MHRKGPISKHAVSTFVLRFRGDLCQTESEHLYFAFVLLFTLMGCLDSSSDEQTQTAFKNTTATVAVLPDTQNYTHAEGTLHFFEEQAAWLSERAGDLNLKLVAHLGDVVHEGDRLEDWMYARTAMQVLDGHVPYLIAPGNHDYGTDPHATRVAADRSTYLHDFFLLEDFQAMPTFGAAFEEGERVDNSFHTFQVGDEDWLVIALEFGPRSQVVEWADKILANHPNHRVILITHAFLYTDGNRYDWAKYGEEQPWNPHSNTRYGLADLPGGVNDGEELWNALVVPHPNVVAVVCGHAHGGGTTDRSRDGVATRIDQGTGVAQMLVNFQEQPQGGEGYMRLLKIDSEARQIHALTYSPSLDRYIEDDESDFVFAYRPPTMLRDADVLAPSPKPTPNDFDRLEAN